MISTALAADLLNRFFHECSDEDFKDIIKIFSEERKVFEASSPRAGQPVTIGSSRAHISLKVNQLLSKHVPREYENRPAYAVLSAPGNRREYDLHVGAFGYSQALSMAKNMGSMAHGRFRTEVVRIVDTVQWQDGNEKQSHHFKDGPL